MSEYAKVPSWVHQYFFREDRERLARLIAAGRFPQVTMFEGRRGIGKRQFAAQIAAIPYCKRKTGCGECAECRQILCGQHTEVVWVESLEGKLKVEDAVVVQEHLATYPSAGRPRTVVIARCEELLPAAANRLLKTWEEPPQGARIIMTTDAARSLLPTILSRTVRIRLAPPPLEEALGYLENAAPGVSRDIMLKALRWNGHVPAAAAQWIQDRNAEGTDDWRTLDPIKAGEKVARKKDFHVVESLDDAERRLNEIYRRKGADFGPMKMNQRRLWRKSVRAIAARGKVPLNKQLFVEQLLVQQENQ